MSNRYRKDSSRGRGNPKIHEKFVPKTLISPQIPTPTLSNSLRNSTSDSARVRVSSSRGEAEGGGNFVNYLPQDEAVAAGLGVDEGGLNPVESQRVVDVVNRELSRLLRLNPRDFWREVATDASLHEFLDSFLKFRSRWYDFTYHGAKGIVAGVIVGDLELSRRVFMVLYRISSNKDPGARAADSLSSKDHEVILQEKKLLDLPKLLDICAIYSHENEDLTQSLVVNAIKSQPKIHGDFTSMIAHFLNIVHTMYQRCSSSVEAIISSGGREEQKSSRRHVEYLEVMDFLNDAIVSIDAFVTSYPRAAIFFSCPVELSHGNEELLNMLARLHDSLLPSLQHGLQVVLSSQENGLGKTPSVQMFDVTLSSKILSTRIVDFSWKLLDCCYLSYQVFKESDPVPTATKMFPANVEDPVVRADVLVQTFKEIAHVTQHAQANYYGGTFLQHIEKRHRLMQRVESLKSSGWIILDDEQHGYLTAIMSLPTNAINGTPTPSTSVRSDNIQTDEDSVIMESKISQIKDLFPEYGKGFLSACLEAYDHNPEEVIQRILEGTLHEDLKILDPSSENVPRRTEQSPSRNDKGKGKVSDSVELPVPNKVSSSSSSLSSTGRFVRKAKSDARNHVALDARDEKHREKTAALLSQYENEYEDEYDDSFDDLGFSVVESAVEEPEILGERISASRGRENDSFAPSTATTSRWGSKKKPQYFVKDGKNYSYKVEGSVAVSDYKQASLVNQAQKEQIHGLGRGGNLPLGAAKAVEEMAVGEGGDEPGALEGEGRGRGRGRGRRGGGRNHYRKDRAMRKHISGLGGF